MLVLDVQIIPAQGFRGTIEFHCHSCQHRHNSHLFGFQIERRQRSSRSTEFSQFEQQTLRKSRRPIEHLAAIHCSCFFSYSKRPSIAIRPIDPQVPANRLDQRPAVPQFKQPSSTCTVSLSTASLSTSTTFMTECQSASEQKISLKYQPETSERVMGFEPTTSSLGS